MFIPIVFGNIRRASRPTWPDSDSSKGRTIMKKLLMFALAISLAVPALRAADDGKIPPDQKEAKARLNKTPRHGEFVDITVPGAKVPLKSFIAYPEVKDKHPSSSLSAR